jgi:hypothetical protein
MPNLREAPPEEIAQRMRDIADSLTDPADIAVARHYVSELEASAAKQKRAYSKRAV